MKTPGQIAYEKLPDENPPWEQLAPWAKQVWEEIAQAVRTHAATEWKTAR